MPRGVSMKWETCRACRCPICEWPLATLEHGGCQPGRCTQDTSRCKQAVVDAQAAAHRLLTWYGDSPLFVTAEREFQLAIEVAAASQRVQAVIEAATVDCYNCAGTPCKECGGHVSKNSGLWIHGQPGSCSLCGGCGLRAAGPL